MLSILLPTFDAMRPWIEMDAKKLQPKLRYSEGWKRLDPMPAMPSQVGAGASVYARRCQPYSYRVHSCNPMMKPSVLDQFPTGSLLSSILTAYQ